MHPWLRLDVKTVGRLQEALLSDNRSNCQNLCIQFSDGPIPLNSLLKNDVPTLYNPEKALGVFFSRLPRFGIMVENLSTLTRVLEHRKTSRPKDEALCLISVLGGDVKKLVGMALVDQRMQAFYSLLKDCHLKSCPQEMKPKYRWLLMGTCVSLNFLQKLSCTWA